MQLIDTHKQQVKTGLKIAYSVQSTELKQPKEENKIRCEVFMNEMATPHVINCFI